MSHNQFSSLSWRKILGLESELESRFPEGQSRSLES